MAIVDTEISLALGFFAICARRSLIFRQGDVTSPWTPEYLATSSFSNHMASLRRQLVVENAGMNTGQEGNVRGWLLQLVAQEVLDRMVSEPYTVVHAPPEFDATFKTPHVDKGGDLLLTKRHEDGSHEVVCIIDVTRKKPRKDVGDAVNYRLHPIPVILLQFNNVMWKSGKDRRETQWFLQRVVRHAITTGELEEVLHSLSDGETIEQVRAKIRKGIDLTREILQERKGNPSTQTLLAQIALAEQVFGL